MKIQILKNTAGKGYHGLEAETFFKNESNQYFKILTMKRYCKKTITTIEEVKTDYEESLKKAEKGENFLYSTQQIKAFESITRNIKRLTKKALLSAHKESLDKFLIEYK